MFHRYRTHRLVSPAVVIAMGAASCLACALFLAQAERLAGAMPLIWLAAAIGGAWIVVILARQVLSSFSQTIAKLVSEADADSSSMNSPNRQKSPVYQQQESQKSDLALLQMTLGPRFF